MVHFVSMKACKELNEYGYTDIYDQAGEITTGSIKVKDGVYACIYNLFESGETIPLKKIEIDDDGNVLCYIKEAETPIKFWVLADESLFGCKKVWVI